MHKKIVDKLTEILNDCPYKNSFEIFWRYHPSGIGCEMMIFTKEMNHYVVDLAGALGRIYGEQLDISDVKHPKKGKDDIIDFKDYVRLG